MPESSRPRPGLRSQGRCLNPQGQVLDFEAKAEASILKAEVWTSRPRPTPKSSRPSPGLRGQGRGLNTQGQGLDFEAKAEASILKAKA